MSQKIKTNFTCPTPQFDFDVITLGHGSGGMLTNQLLESGVFTVLDNKYLETRHDGAIIQGKGSMAMSTDSFVVSPIFFPGGNIGDLAVNGTVNDLAMCGAIPEYLSLGFVIEEGLKISEFWEVLQSLKKACDYAGIQVVTGDTKVVERGKGDKLFINTTGIGHLHQKAAIHPDNIRSGDVVIVSGHLAVHGITIMSLREGLSFGTSLQSDTRPLNHMVSSLLDKFGNDIHLLRDATRGGVATVLSEISKLTGFGMDIEESALPVPEEVDGACEMLGLDPLYVANEGVFCAFVRDDTSGKLLKELQKLPGGEHAAIIGQIVDDHPRKVILKNEIGGRRAIDLLPGDQLPRIC